MDVIMSSTAVAVVIYCEEMHLKPLLEVMSAQDKQGKVWIYTLSFTFIPGVFSEGPSKLLNGSIGLVLHSEAMPGFSSYLQSLHLSKYPNDMFIDQFWEDAFDCQLTTNNSVSPLLESSRTCTGEEELGDLVTLLFEMEDLSYTFQAYLAVYAFAYALHNLMSCTNEDGYSEPGKCERETISPWKIYLYLRNVSFRTRSGDRVFFNEAGEIPAMFDVMNLQIFPDNNYRLLKVGKYDSQATLNEQITLDIPSIIWNQVYRQMPHSVCSKSCQPGRRKNVIKGQPVCCFQCVPCSVGEITNETDATVCLKCPEDQWPNEYQVDCLLKAIQYLSYEETMGFALAATSITSSAFTLLVVCIFKKYSETPVVKANNRNISYIILSALTTCFLSALLFIGYPIRVTCLLRQIVFGITFSVVVSGMLAKTITVILVFKSTKPGAIGKRFDSRISTIVIVFCPFLQIGICMVWLLMSPPFPELNTRARADTILAECNEGSNIFFYSMLGYMGLLATVSFVVAFLSRKLPDSFNEGQYITFSMFVFLSVWLCFIPAYLSAEGKNVVIVEVFAILASSAGLLSCLFFPKCYIILLRPDMNTKQYVRGK
uniref:G-protein coupled receptors family 3 profile domain-containing protein n=1 Tax=Leptobrachium leishanense TaxID=445787 RepID=A0A8C5R468_9ANUR